MSSPAIQKRQIALLRKLTERSGGRTDAMIPLAEVAPTITITAFAGGGRFTDKDNPKYEGGSDLSYDLNMLLDNCLVQVDHMTHKQDAEGGLVYEHPAIKVTPEGFYAIEEAGKWWLQKAIDKEPITFLQIIVTILVGIGGWLVGRYITPAGHGDPAPVISKSK